MNLIGQSLSICIKKATDYLNIPCRYTSFYHKQDLNTIPFNIDNGPVILSFEGIEHFIISYGLACPVIYANMVSYCQETNLTLEHVGYDKIEKKIYDICLDEHDTVNENAILLPRGIVEDQIQNILVDCKFEEFLEYTINYVFTRVGKVPIFHLPSVPVANIYNIKTENKKALSLKIQEIVDDTKRNIFISIYQLERTGLKKQ